MNDLQTSEPATASSGAGTTATGVSSVPTTDRSRERERIQRLVDQAASFNMFAVPESGQSGAASSARKGGDAAGIRQRLALHRFDIILNGPTSEGVKAANNVGQVVGRVDLQLLMIPYDYQAAPGRQPPPTPLNPEITQRFVLQEATFAFGGGEDGFRSFGTGRTFPMMSGDKPQLVAAAIGVIMEGFGKFRGIDGNLTLCGQLTAERGFTGHIMIRAVDQEGVLLTGSELSPLEADKSVDPQATFLSWIGQKGEGPDQENQFSAGQDAQVRGLNIPVHLKRVFVGFTAGAGGFRASRLKTSEIVGREVGFGRGSVPGAGPSGSTLSPFLFEGVSLYAFYDEAGNTVGTLTANVLEGRRFDVKLIRAPQEPALRFGFFGPVIFGTGSFRGAQGTLYGASGSVFKLPPDMHVISNWYVLRLIDPKGKYRA